ncbi:hypothetical protein THAOC_17816, partial [Thalassiosira oceanica]
TFMPSRRRSPAAVGKLSFPRFKVYYLPRRRVRFEPRLLDFRKRDLPNATAYGGSDGIYNNLRNSRNDAIRLAPASPAKQHRAEAAPGPDGDDNGPGSEPPPHGRFRYVSTFVTSRRRPPAAVGKPSFAYFPVDYLLHDVWRPDEPTDFRERYLLDATPYERSEDNGITLRNPRNNAIPLASAEMDFFDIILLTKQFWPVYGAMDPLLAYTLALIHLLACYTPRGSGKTTWEPTSSSTPTATPCFRAEIVGFEPPGTPQIQQVYGAMDPLLAYTLALMHLLAFYTPRGSGKTTWEPTSSSTPTATPCFRAEIVGFEPPGTPQIQQVSRCADSTRDDLQAQKVR